MCIRDRNYVNLVVNNNETVIVVREDEKNIVIISNEKYNQFEKIARNTEIQKQLYREYGI